MRAITHSLDELTVPSTLAAEAAALAGGRSLMADAVLRAGPFALRPAHSTPLGAVVHCRRWSRDYGRHPRPRAGTTTAWPRKGRRAAMWRSEASARSG